MAKKKAIIKLRKAVKGNHIHVQMFMGTEGETLVHNGNFVMTQPEWDLFCKSLKFSAEYFIGSNMELVVEDMTNDEEVINESPKSDNAP